MTCTTPQIPHSHSHEAEKFAKQFGEQTTKFIGALHLPSATDPSVLSYKSKTGPYFVKELEDSNILQPFIQDSLNVAIRGLSITVDTATIVNDVSNVVKTIVGGAKTTPTFGGFSSTSYRGTYSGKDVIYKVIIAVYTADASKLYDSKPESVLELAYYAYLTVQKAD